MSNQDNQSIEKGKKSDNNYKILVIPIVLLIFLFIGLYFAINDYFERKIQFRAFEECLSVVNDSGASWITRKSAIDYCKEQFQ